MQASNVWTHLWLHRLLNCISATTRIKFRECFRDGSAIDPCYVEEFWRGEASRILLKSDAVEQEQQSKNFALLASSVCLYWFCLPQQNVFWIAAFTQESMTLKSPLCYLIYASLLKPLHIIGTYKPYDAWDRVPSSQATDHILLLLHADGAIINVFIQTLMVIRCHPGFTNQ